MTTHFRTLLLLGFTGLSALVSGCIIETSSSGPSATCADYQYFTVEWEVDRGSVATMLPCSLTPPSTVEVTTNTGLVLSLLTPTCDDRQFYNWRSTTGSGLAVGTTLVAADLVADTGDLLSFADVPPNKQFPIASCAPASLSIQFPLQ
jgi:hypothetical protein